MTVLEHPIVHQWMLFVIVFVSVSMGFLALTPYHLNQNFGLFKFKNKQKVWTKWYFCFLRKNKLFSYKKIYFSNLVLKLKLVVYKLLINIFQLNLSVCFERDLFINRINRQNWANFNVKHMILYRWHTLNIRKYSIREAFASTNGVMPDCNSHCRCIYLKLLHYERCIYFMIACTYNGADFKTIFILLLVLLDCHYYFYCYCKVFLLVSPPLFFSHSSICLFVVE